MTPEQFCYWLRGALEAAPEGGLSAEQRAKVQQHLDLVMADVSGDEGVQREVRRVLNRPTGPFPSNLIC